MSEHQNAILNLQLARHRRQVTMDWLQQLIDYVYSKKLDGVTLKRCDVEISALREAALLFFEVTEYELAAAFMKEAIMCHEAPGALSSIPLSELCFEYAEIVVHVCVRIKIRSEKDRAQAAELEKTRVQALEKAIRLSKAEMEACKTRHQKMEEALKIAKMQLEPRWLRK
jgi:hypothetical protein